MSAFDFGEAFLAGWGACDLLLCVLGERES